MELVDIHGVGFVIFITAAMEVNKKAAIFICHFVKNLFNVLQVIAVAWVYGLKNICRDLEFMLKIRINWYWKICWGFICPVSLTFLFFYEIQQFKIIEGLPISAAGESEKFEVSHLLVSITCSFCMQLPVGPCRQSLC